MIILAIYPYYPAQCDKTISGREICTCELEVAGLISPARSSLFKH